MASTTVPVAPAAAEPSVVSIPMSPNEDALKIFESTLRASVQDIVSKSGLPWTTFSISHRGTDPKRLELCPPTIVVTSPTVDPLKQQGWMTVQAKIREEIKKRTNVHIDVAIVQGTPITFQDVGIPYPSPPPIGYSFGVAEEQLGKHDKSHSGTLGGYLVLPGMHDMRVAMTCNHVGNPRILVPKEENPEKLTPHAMRCPSNEDNADTLRKAAASLIFPSEKGIFNNDKKKAFQQLMEGIKWESIPGKIEKIVFPAGTGRQIGNDWDDFQQANIGGDYVTAMASLPTAIELEHGAAAIGKCELNQKIRALRASFDELWNEEMANASSATYRQARDTNRQLGTTKYASGLRVWPNSATTGPCIVDWSLVETPGVQGVNKIPEELKKLAEAYHPGCPLAKGTPISSVSALQAGQIVFKIGRKSEASAGIVDASKVRISQESLMLMDALPADGKLEGHSVAYTDEWNVTGAKFEKGELVGKGLQFARPGDSGAWVVNANSELVGMVYCGMESAGQSYMQEASMIWDSVKMVTGEVLAFPKV